MYRLPGSRSKTKNIRNDLKWAEMFPMGLAVFKNCSSFKMLHEKTREKMSTHTEQVKLLFTTANAKKNWSKFVRWNCFTPPNLWLGTLIDLYACFPVRSSGCFAWFSNLFRFPLFRFVSWKTENAIETERISYERLQPDGWFTICVLI